MGAEKQKITYTKRTMLSRHEDGSFVADIYVIKQDEDFGVLDAEYAASIYGADLGLTYSALKGVVSSSKSMPDKPRKQVLL